MRQKESSKSVYLERKSEKNTKHTAELKCRLKVDFST